jgi:hypothetical protein
MSMTIRVVRLFAAVTAVVALTSACTRESASPPQRAGRDSAATIAAPAPDSAAFENRVWKVARSATVEAGQLYVFLSDGTLLVASAHGTPSLGAWHLSPGGMTMVEEGIPYEVSILRSTPDSLSIRMANPGEPVTIELVHASTGGAPSH